MIPLEDICSTEAGQEGVVPANFADFHHKYGMDRPLALSVRSAPFLYFLRPETERI
jgi:hypothetical protein